MVTMHELITVFAAIMPAVIGFANWRVPLLINASDMTFARMNNFLVLAAVACRPAAEHVILRWWRCDRFRLEAPGVRVEVGCHVWPGRHRQLPDEIRNGLHTVT